MVLTRLLDIIFWGFGKVSKALRIRLGIVLGWTLEHALRFRRETVRIALVRAFPELDEKGVRRLMSRVYRHLGLLFTELLALPTTSAEELEKICAIRDEENYVRAASRGNGVLILAAHVGNWELGLAACGRLQAHSRTVVKEIKGALGQYAVTRMREAHGVATIPRRKSFKLIAQTLRAGGTVGFVLDQNMTADEGIFVDFFGRAACTMSGLAVIAHRYRAPVVPIVFFRDEDLWHHTVEFLPEIEWEEVSGTLAENLRHNTQRYTAVLEGMIRAHPDQWLWIHRRWRTQPQGAGEGDQEERTKETGTAA